MTQQTFDDMWALETVQKNLFKKHGHDDVKHAFPKKEYSEIEDTYFTSDNFASPMLHPMHIMLDSGTSKFIGDARIDYSSHRQDHILDIHFQGKHYQVSRYKNRSRIETLGIYHGGLTTPMSLKDYIELVEYLESKNYERIFQKN